MTNTKSTKRALLSSILATFLCFAMLLGTTFAWFTDKVESANNIIKSGNLDIELLHTNTKDTDETVDSNVKLFDDVTYWEPGVMVWEKFTVKNVGNLDFKYQFTLNVLNATEIVTEEETYSFADMLQVAVVDVATIDAAKGNGNRVDDAQIDWQPLETFTFPGELYDAEEAAADPADKKESSDTFGIIIWWEPSDDDDLFNMNNGAQEVVKLEVGVNLIATQLNNEQDGFGNDYDEDAWTDGMLIFTAQDLQAAIDAGERDLTLMDHIETESPIVVQAAAATLSMRRAASNAITINLNGYSLTATNGNAIENNGDLVITGDGELGNVSNGGGLTIDSAAAVAEIANEGILTITGGAQIEAIANSGDVEITGDGKIDAIANDGTLTITGSGKVDAIANEGTLTIDGKVTIDSIDNSGNVTIDKATIGTENSDAIINKDNGTVTIKGGTINAGINSEGEGKVEITGGTINADINSEGEGKVEITGGTINSEITGDADNVVVSGGTLNNDSATDYLKEGLVAYEYNGTFVIVSENYDGIIFNAESLTEAAAKGGEYLVIENLTLADAYNVLISNDMTLDLNGKKIIGKDTTSNSFGLFNIAVGKKLTINDSVGSGEISLSSTIESGWGRYSAVISNQRGILEVNGGTIQHNGGTSMSYAIDALSNTGADKAMTTINGGVIQSSYIGIRLYCNSTSGLDELVINDGTIIGVRRSVWMQNPNSYKNLGKMTINGGTLLGEMTIGADHFEVAINGGAFNDLTNALAYATEGAVITLAQNVAVTETIKIPAGKTVVLDLNGYTLSGTFDGTGNQDMFLVNGDLTVKNGTVEMVATQNQGWNAMSAIFDITAGGVVTLDKVVAENKGGTDMNFVAHLNNWGTASLYVYNSTLKATYTAVRVFNSGYDMNNVTIKNSVLSTTGNSAFWVHNYTAADFGTQEKADSQAKLLNFVFENNTFEAKKAAFRLGMTNAEYYTADGAQIIWTADELKAALKNGAGKIALYADIDMGGETLTVTKDVVLDLNGYVLSGTCNGGQGHLIMVNNAASLSIYDTSVAQTGKITYAKGTSNTGWTIDLEGELNLYSGTLELTGSDWSIGYVVDVRPNAWGTNYTEDTVFHMYGGKLISSDGAVRVASSSSDTYANIVATFIMDDGEIVAAWDGIFVQQSNTAYDTLNVTINGGSVTSALSPIRVYAPVATSVNAGTEKPMTITINGGDLTVDGAIDESRVWHTLGKLVIGGGITLDDLNQYATITIQ